MDHKTTRRQWALIVGGLGIAVAPARAAEHGATIHQEIDFLAKPARIYAILLDAKEFSAFTKDKADVRPEAGAAFKLFGGRIEGRNVELVADRRIVQAWRPSAWPAGVYSLVRFELTARDAGTRIVFDHTGFPEEEWESLNTGWPRMYWEPLRKYLNA